MLSKRAAAVSGVVWKSTAGWFLTRGRQSISTSWRWVFRVMHGLLEPRGASPYSQWGFLHSKDVRWIPLTLQWLNFIYAHALRKMPASLLLLTNMLTPILTIQTLWCIIFLHQKKSQNLKLCRSLLNVIGIRWWVLVWTSRSAVKYTVAV